uniref:Uncharacterized protein n=1 Tax=Anguilla anguilla TaxID=7936 RepID=A0A0E9VIR1_ANGAN
MPSQNENGSTCAGPEHSQTPNPPLASMHNCIQYILKILNRNVQNRNCLLGNIPIK